jgi:hypothetical protein
MTATPHRGDVAPGYLLYLTDPARAAIDYTLLACVTPLLASFPRCNNHSALALPRMHATDASTSTLLTVLRQLGYRTYGWRLGRNIGPTRKVVDGLRARLAYLTNRHSVRSRSSVGVSAASPITLRRFGLWRTASHSPPTD